MNEIWDDVKINVIIDSNGESVEVIQDTPCSNQKKDSYITFSCNVDIQTNINKLPPGT